MLECLKVGPGKDDAFAMVDRVRGRSDEDAKGEAVVTDALT